MLCGTTPLPLFESEWYHEALRAIRGTTPSTTLLPLFESEWYHEALRVIRGTTPSTTLLLTHVTTHEKAPLAVPAGLSYSRN